jgi:hypothetical protein
VCLLEPLLRLRRLWPGLDLDVEDSVNHSLIAAAGIDGSRSYRKPVFSHHGFVPLEPWNIRTQEKKKSRKFFANHISIIVRLPALLKLGFNISSDQATGVR